MIKWCLGIWDELDTQYIAVDEEKGGYYLTPFLEEAVLFNHIKKGNPPATVWLPVFLPTLKGE